MQSNHTKKNDEVQVPKSLVAMKRYINDFGKLSEQLTLFSFHLKTHIMVLIVQHYILPKKYSNHKFFKEINRQHW